MIIIITGASHTGKTLLAQELLEKYKFPYLSVDHLKMGLIRSKNTDLTPNDDEELVAYLWAIIREIIKTAVENRQNLIVEGCYIPLNWQNDFTKEYLKDIRFFCLVMSENYIERHFSDIKKYANEIERRINDEITKQSIVDDNVRYLELCRKYGQNYILIDGEYKVQIDL